MGLHPESLSIARIGIGVACAAGVGAGGCYAAGLFGRGGNKALDRTDWSLVSIDRETYEAGTVGAMFGRYLLSPYATDENREKHVQKWRDKFHKSFTNRSSGVAFHPSFDKTMATSAYQPRTNADGKGLNRLCDGVYRTKGSEITMQANLSNADQNLGFSILRFCSPLENVPTTLGDDAEGYGENSIGKERGIILVDTKDSANEGFWKAQQKWFVSLGDGVTDAFFREYIRSDAHRENDFLRRACEAAYGKPSNAAEATRDRPLADDVEKYCSFSAEEE